MDDDDDDEIVVEGLTQLRIGEDNIGQQQIGDTKLSYANAATVRGVFSDTPLDKDAFDFLTCIPEPDIEIMCITSASKEDVAAWTQGAQDELSQLREVVRRHISHRLSRISETSRHEADGRKAILSSAKDCIL